jgi:glucan phosphoethanolaminetransferase (alkaline phosphatase superfamily)
MSANSNNVVKSNLNIKKLDNEGHNYCTWATHCQMVLDLLLKIHLLLLSKKRTQQRMLGKHWLNDMLVLVLMMLLFSCKFAMIISEALPPSYDTLKAITVATVSDVSKLAVDMLIAQILREEKWKGSQKSATALVAKSERLSDKSLNVKQNKKSKKGMNPLQCTNPKCNKIGHTLEQCWAKGGGSEGQCSPKPDNAQGAVSKDM